MLVVQEGIGRSRVGLLGGYLWFRLQDTDGAQDGQSIFGAYWRERL